MAAFPSPEERLIARGTAADAKPAFLRSVVAHRVARNTTALVLVQFANYASSFLVLIHLTRILGVTTYGVVAYSIGIVQLLSVVLDLGFAMSATRNIATIRDDREAVARFAGAVLTLKLIAFAIGAVGLVAYGLLTQKYAANRTIFILSMLPLLGHALQPVWLFQGLERMRFVTVFTVLAKMSFVLLVFVLVRTEADYVRVPIADGFAQAAAAVIGLALVWKVGYAVRVPTSADIAGALRMTSGFLVSRVASTVQSNAGVIILGLVASPATVAVYALAEQLYRAMHSVFAPVTHALYPYMARERDFGLLARVTLGCAVIALLGSIIGHVLGPAVIPSLLGASWRPSLAALDIFFIGIVVHVFVLMGGYPLAAALDRVGVANTGTVVATLLYLCFAAAAMALGLASPTTFAWLLVGSEVYLLGYFGLKLLPTAIAAYARQRDLRHREPAPQREQAGQA